MKKFIVVFITFYFISLSSVTYAKTTDFVSGYNGIKWGSDLSKKKGFVMVINKTPWSAFKNAFVFKLAGDNTIVLDGKKNIQAEEILYITINAKLEAVYIIVSQNNANMAQRFFFLQNSLKKHYGKPSEVTDTGREIFYNRNGASLKLSMGKKTTMVIYAPGYKSRLKTFK